MIQTLPVVAVLDDEPQMRNALRRRLATHGFRVEAYEQANDFLAALSSHPGGASRFVRCMAPMSSSTVIPPKFSITMSISCE